MNEALIDQTVLCVKRTIHFDVSVGSKEAGAKSHMKANLDMGSAEVHEGRPHSCGQSVPAVHAILTNFKTNATGRRYLEQTVFREVVQMQFVWPMEHKA